MWIGEGLIIAGVIINAIISINNHRRLVRIEMEAASDEALDT